MPIDFDGLDSRIDYNNITEINGLTAATFCCWAKVNSLTRDHVVMSKGSAGIHAFKLYRDDVGSLTARTDTCSIKINNDAVELEGATGLWNDTNWHFICATFVANSLTGLRLYFDGVEDANSPVSTIGQLSLTSPTFPFLVGRLSIDTEVLDGSIEDVRVYNRALSLAEIQTIYNSRGADNIIEGGILRCKLNEGAPGTEAKPSSPHRGTTTASVASSANLTLNVPTVSDGNLLVAAICTEDGGVVTTPTGWTLANSGDVDLPAGPSSPNLYVFYRTASSEPASYTFETDATDDILGIMVSYDHTNLVSLTPEIISSLNTGTSTTPTAPTISPTADSLVLRIMASDDDAIYTTPSTTFDDPGVIGRAAIEIDSGGASPNGCSLAIADQELASGATGTSAFLLVTSEDWGCLTISWKGGSGPVDLETVKDEWKNKYNGRPMGVLTKPLYSASLLTQKKRRTR